LSSFHPLSYPNFCYGTGTPKVEAKRLSRAWSLSSRGDLLPGPQSDNDIGHFVSFAAVKVIKRLGAERVKRG